METDIVGDKTYCNDIHRWGRVHGNDEVEKRACKAEFQKDHPQPVTVSNSFSASRVTMAVSSDGWVLACSKTVRTFCMLEVVEHPVKGG